MDINIRKEIKSLKWIYIVHIFILALVLSFNIILLYQIYWLKEILRFLYLFATIISIIYFIIPIIALIFICINKLKKNNIKIFKIFSLVFCVISIFLGILFVGTIIINTKDSPEFERECPFNLPIEDINNIIESNDLINKCPERRCVINSKNYKTLGKNENYYYEYICNYDPTSEFEEMKKINYDDYGDYIKCDLININHLRISELKNNFVSNFYYNCYIYVEFYKCERNKKPDEFDLKENFKCPSTNYMTLLIVFCFFDAILNLIINFLQYRLEYNAYLIITDQLSIINRKTNSISSTLNSSKIQNENIDNKNKFEQLPTEILIVSNDNNINNINNINKENKNINEKNEENIINMKIDNETILKNLNINSIAEINNNIKNKNKKEFQNGKIIEKISKLNFESKTEDKEKEDNKEKKLKFEEGENKENLSFDDYNLSTKRVMLEDEKDSKK